LASMLGLTIAHLAPLLMCTFLLAACGDVAFKRGGSATDFEAAQHRCADKEGDAASYRACLEEAGWTTKNWDIDSVSDRSVSASQAPKPVEASAPISKTSDKIAPASAPSAIEATLYRVNAWWKTGGSADALNLALAACTDSSSHGASVVSRAMLDCMAARGWHGTVAPYAVK
jgi:hypothetical protein